MVADTHMTRWLAAQPANVPKTLLGGGVFRDTSGTSVGQTLISYCALLQCSYE